MAKVKGAYITWRATDQGPGGVLRFDAVTAETFISSATATEFPVEQGANVSDHVRKNLDKLTMEVVVSNTPIHGYHLLSAHGTRGRMQSVTLDIPQAKRGFGLSALIGRVVDLFKSKPATKASVLVFDTPFIATAETLDALVQLQTEGRLIDIVSRDWYLESMIIENITAPRTPDLGTSAKFTIDFKQIRIVETRQTTAPVPAEPRAKGIANGGTAGSKDAKGDRKKSLLKAGKDWLASGGLSGGGS